MKFTPFDLRIGIDGQYGFSLLAIETEYTFRSLFGISAHNPNYNYKNRVEICIFFRVFQFK